MPSFCRITGHSGLSSSQIQQIDYQRNVIPPAMRSPTPMEMFLYRSQTAGAHKIPGKHTCDNYTLYMVLAEPASNKVNDNYFY